MAPYIAKVRLDGIPSTVQENRTGSGLIITPHPVHDRAILALPPDQGAVTVTVTDLCGREVVRTTTEDASCELATQAWPSGAYVVRVAGRTVT